jgi:hypothetical protein
MSLDPCAHAELHFPSRPPRGRRLATAAALGLLLAVAPRCAPWDDEPPPASAAEAANAPPAGPPPADPNAPLAPGGPIAPSGQTTAPPDDPKYASGEYAIGSDTDSYDDNDPSALNDFRKPLDPYGSWVDDPTYGTVWVPSPDAVGPDFQPYLSGGHWAYDDDYVWVSDYPWGWAPFHYGRWIYVESRGWSWIPGREYRGAWVTWSVDDGYSYLGWAPMGPAFLWFGGAAVGFHGYWGPRWAYCPRGEVFAPRVGAHVVVGPAAVAIASRMRPYAAANVRVGGPPPARFGYTAAQVPRATAAPGVAHAQEFSRPSSGRALGASAPARFEAAPAARSPVTDVRAAPGGAHAPGASPAPNVNRVQAAPLQGRAPAPARGIYHASPGGGSRGGGHRR